MMGILLHDILLFYCTTGILLYDGYSTFIVQKNNNDNNNNNNHNNNNNRVLYDEVFTKRHRIRKSDHARLEFSVPIILLGLFPNDRWFSSWFRCAQIHLHQYTVQRKKYLYNRSKRYIMLVCAGRRYLIVRLQGRAVAYCFPSGLVKRKSFPLLNLRHPPGILIETNRIQEGKSSYHRMLLLPIQRCAYIWCVFAWMYPDTGRMHLIADARNAVLLYIALMMPRTLSLSRIVVGNGDEISLLPVPTREKLFICLRDVRSVHCMYFYVHCAPSLSVRYSARRWCRPLS